MVSRPAGADQTRPPDPPDGGAGPVSPTLALATDAQVMALKQLALEYRGQIAVKADTVFSPRPGGAFQVAA